MVGLQAADSWGNGGGGGGYVEGFGESPGLTEVDWSQVPREQFRRSFLELPSFEPTGAEELRQSLGVRVEDLGGLPAAPAPVASFEELGALPDYAIDGLREHGITAPMPIQAQAMPLVLGGCDVIGLAQTGSGKTMAFLLPAVAHIEVQPELAYRAATPIALVLAPTRELAVQISDEATKVLNGSKRGNHRRGIWACCIYGGGKKGDQMRNLSWGSHIVVATPGRLIDFVSQGIVSMERVTYLVLDEADRMLDLGFSGDVDSLSAQIRPERQVLFFSATWSPAVQELASGLCHRGATPVRISVGQNRGNGEHGDSMEGAGARLAREGIVQEVVVVDFPKEEYERQVSEKRRLLDEHLEFVLSESEENKVLVFVSQKTLADELSTRLWDEGFKAAAMHGGKSQDSRLWTLDQFRKGEIRLLVATDVIGRGIDIPSVSHVVVFEMGTIDDYVHRIGRTARGKDARGHALVFFEYYWKEPTIAAQLIELLAASKQPVPDGLRRIASEVLRGEREVFEQKGKWGGSKWGSWNSSGNNSEWNSNGGGGGGTGGSWRNGGGGCAGGAPWPPSGSVAAYADESWDEASPTGLGATAPLSRKRPPTTIATRAERGWQQQRRDEPQIVPDNWEDDE